MVHRPTQLGTHLAYDDSGGAGRPVILLPGAGDLRSENRFLAAELVAAGYRTISADLPGHGDSPIASSYGVAETAAELIKLIDHLDSGPVVIIANSFAPAAAVWAASEDPDKVRALVAISPHFTTGESFQGRLTAGLTKLLIRGPWAPSIWERLYRGWYKSRAPEDLDVEIQRLRAMLADPARRRAVRGTLTAHRHGVEERMGRFAAPALVVFGAADDHFPDPAAEAAEVAARLGGETVMVEGAGHYPHVERADVVGPAVLGFLSSLPG